MAHEIPEKWKRLHGKLQSHWKELASVSVGWRTGSGSYKPLKELHATQVEDEDGTPLTGPDEMLWEIVELAAEQAAERGPRIDVEIFGYSDKKRQLFRDARQVIAGDGDGSIQNMEQSAFRNLMAHTSKLYEYNERLAKANAEMGEKGAGLLGAHAEGVGKLATFYGDAFSFVQNYSRADAEAHAETEQAREMHQTLRHFGQLFFEFGPGSSMGGKREKPAKPGDVAKAMGKVRDTWNPVRDAARELMGEPEAWARFDETIRESAHMDDGDVVRAMADLTPIFERFGARLMELMRTPAGTKFLGSVKRLRDACAAWVKSQAEQSQA